MRRFLILLTLVACHSCKKKEMPQPKPLAKVEAAEVLSTTFPICLTGIGHVKAFNSAEIKAQVEGRLEKIHYTQGDFVAKGDLLITIDPRPYQAKLQEAEGILQESEVNCRFAQEKVMRYSSLIKDDYVSKINFDEFLTNVQSLEASVKKNRGVVEEAKVNLSYCYIKAPFSGRVGKKLIDEGNLIDNSGATLVLLQQIEPIYIDFSLPEKHIISIINAEKEHQLVIEAHLCEGAEINPTGKLIVIDNKVDSKTGMIPLRAQFTNEQEHLWPGQFAKIRLVLNEQENTLVAPDSAINLSQKGFFVYLLDGEKKVKVQPVKVGERVNGVCEIISGLSKGDLVVTNGQFNITEGQEVNIVSIDRSFLSELKMW